MKKLFFSLAITAALLSCSKDKDENCYWTDHNGTDHTEYPSATEIQQMADDCSCTPTFTKHCD